MGHSLFLSFNQGRAPMVNSVYHYLRPISSKSKKRVKNGRILHTKSPPLFQGRTDYFFSSSSSIAAVAIVAIDLADMSDYLLGSTAATVIVAVALVLVGILGSPMIYGFGEIVNCVKGIRDQSKN